jgi:hypothetical protein
MMAPTHREMASSWWLGGVLLVEALGADVHPAVALTGAVIARRFGYGRFSPDADTSWLSHLGHRQVTHRPGTAATLTAVTCLAWAVLAVAVPVRYGVLLPLVWAPVTGWWSHLVGDAVFGRIPLGAGVGGLLWRHLPEVARGRLILKSRKSRQPFWFGLGLDTDGLIERGNRVLPERNPVTGLHRTVKVLPIAPATALLRLATVAFAVVVLVLPYYEQLASTGQLR